MARISTYTVDNTVEASDKLLGSNADGTTKNFTIEDIATFFKQNNAAGISGQIPYVYYNSGFGGQNARPTGSITLATSDATTAFSTLIERFWGFFLWIELWFSLSTIFLT